MRVDVFFFFTVRNLVDATESLLEFNSRTIIIVDKRRDVDIGGN